MLSKTRMVSLGNRWSIFESGRERQIKRIFCIFTLFLWVVKLSAGASENNNSGANNFHEAVGSNAGKEDLAKGIKVNESESESENKISNNLHGSNRATESQKRWKPVLKEIKEMAVVFPKTSSKDISSSGKRPSFLDQWKSSSYNSTGRFEGFASWERLLQDWAEDAQVYMDKIESETADSEYSMASFGRPSSKSRTTGSNTVQTSDGEKNGVNTPDVKADSAETVREAKSEVASEQETANDLSTSSASSIVLGDEPVRLLQPTPAKPGEEVLPHTDISDKSKNIWIVTTAALPWMTGTAVNPLLRAAYMTEGRKEAGGSVTLMLPWLERREDQESVYSLDRIFQNAEQQEEYIRTWLRDTAKLEEASRVLKIEWYTAWQNKIENSLYSMGDITALIPAGDVDICILEEPEHLNWYRAPGQPWTDKFKHVVGIIHTNYFIYAQEQPGALIRAPGMKLLCSWMCRAHCHRVIKLSGTLGRFAPEKELVENVHGVRASFLDSGEELKKRLEDPSEETLRVFGPNAESSVYFIGKMLWSKGLGSLMELLKYAEESAGIKIKVDMYGGGPDKDAASAKAESLSLDMPFHGPIDHAELAFTHKIFINPSTSEVLCTTVSEALAMGKFVVLPSHPSNDFFAQFPNCLTYTNKEEFVGNLYYALTHSPEPLSDEYAYALSWQAATERLEASGCIPVAEAELFEEARLAKDEGIEITLPPLIENEKGRKLLGSTIRETRDRYRQFRSRLAQEVQRNNVLPSALKNRLVTDLDKRLDLDIESILESPKLRLKLSPAELDKQLLEFYNFIADAPHGDVLRIFGGGGDVALQNLYIKKHARRDRKRKPKGSRGTNSPIFDKFGEEVDATDAKTVSQWVKKALRGNLSNGGTLNSKITSNPSSQSNKEDNSKMTMSLSKSTTHTSKPRLLSPCATTAGQFCPVYRPSVSSFSILI